MKIQIRRNVFETNSSHEHSISIVKEDDWVKWLNGEILGRVVKMKREAGWGNFDSEIFEWEFSNDFDKCKRENEILLNKIKTNGIEQQEKYKNECLNHKKLVKKRLTDEEFEALSEEEQDKYEDDLYEDSLYEFDEDNYNYWRNIYNSMTLDNLEYTSVVLNGFWITYDQYKEDWIDVDCVSPWDHKNETLGVHAFGKYFHS
ncbi:MAG: hypothetical protein IJH39_11885 [Clostridia bacterium]|nr:hypothetical protein [Clostridia bacterium]